MGGTLRALVAAMLVAAALPSVVSVVAAGDEDSGYTWKIESFGAAPEQRDGKAGETYRVDIMLRGTAGRHVSIVKQGQSVQLPGGVRSESIWDSAAAVPPWAQFHVSYAVWQPCRTAGSSWGVIWEPAQWTMHLDARGADGVPMRWTMRSPIPPPPELVRARRLPRALTPSRSGGSDVPIIIPPFTNLMLVRARINAQADLVLLVDTGAQFTVVSPEAAARLNLGAGATRRQAAAGVTDVRFAPVVFDAALQIGEFVFDNLEIAVADVPRVHFAYDGLLGSDVLEHFKVSIDRRARVLRLEATPQESR